MDDNLASTEVWVGVWHDKNYTYKADGTNETKKQLFHGHLGKEMLSRVVCLERLSIELHARVKFPLYAKSQCV